MIARCAAKTAAFFAQLMGWDYGVPSATTVRNWTLRLGLYALDYAGRKAGHYVGILDESIEIGCEKALLFLGVKQRDDRSDFAPLRLSDVEVLGVQVNNSWTQDRVANFVERRMDHHDEIDLDYIISDQGTNLRAALGRLHIPSVLDCTHWLMNALKKLLKDHAALTKLTARMGTFRRKHLLSERSHLTPATLRDKDRFQRLFTILDWVGRIDRCWDQLPSAHRRALGFLKGKRVRQLLDLLEQLRRITVLALNILRTSGINAASRRAWQARIAALGQQLTWHAKAEELIRMVEAYFDHHESLSAQWQRLLCCSDIIESIFGRYKNKGGMKVISADVLVLPLYTQTITIDFVCAGLSRVSQDMVEQWSQDNTCDNRYSRLRRLKQRSKSAARLTG
jgi:hypothetical protein